MGYYTAHTLDIEVYDYQTGQRSVEVPADTLAQIVVALEDRDVIGYALDEDLSCRDVVKWYDHDTDMMEVSKQFPGILFCLHGEGEEPGDIWDAYYLDGKTQHCQAEVVCPPFNPEKLA